MSSDTDHAARTAAFLCEWQVSGAAQRANAISCSGPAERFAPVVVRSEGFATLHAPATVEDIAAHFEDKRTEKRLEEMTKLLETLEAVGRAKNSDDRWHT
ncbi:MAG: hypothetical protein IT229_10490 [Flavobacteriales bacterium]|nr:hypothetical protein [Flavobacteriales bacterium]